MARSGPDRVVRAEIVPGDIAGTDRMRQVRLFASRLARPDLDHEACAPGCTAQDMPGRAMSGGDRATLRKILKRR